jgi:hypothetical protein
MMQAAVRKPRERATTAGPSITDLYQEFEPAHAAYRAMPDSAANKPFDRAVAKACRVADQIVKTPAKTVDEMILKLRIAVWDVGDCKYESLEELDRWTPAPSTKGAEYKAIASLQWDLQRLKVSSSGDWQCKITP